MARRMLDLTSGPNIDLTKDLAEIQAELDASKKQYLTTPEFAKLIGFHEQTLRYWDKMGKFQPHHRTPGGTRMYSLDQIKDLQEIFAADGLFNDPVKRKKLKKAAGNTPDANPDFEPEPVDGFESYGPVPDFDEGHDFEDGPEPPPDFEDGPGTDEPVLSD